MRPSHDFLSLLTDFLSSLKDPSATLSSLNFKLTSANANKHPVPTTKSMFNILQSLIVILWFQQAVLHIISLMAHTEVLPAR